MSLAGLSKLTKQHNAGIDAGETATRNIELTDGRFYEASCFASRPMICWAT